MCTNFDITQLLKAVHEKKQRFSPVLLHCISNILNAHDEFKTTFDSRGNLGVYANISPNYTLFHWESETFFSIWMTYDTSIEQFCMAYKQDMDQYANDLSFMQSQWRVKIISLILPSLGLPLQDSILIWIKGHATFCPSLPAENTMKRKEKYCCPLQCRCIMSCVIIFMYHGSLQSCNFFLMTLHCKK